VLWHFFSEDNAWATLEFKTWFGKHQTQLWSLLHLKGANFEKH
jgi:hypothetical protein